MADLDCKPFWTQHKEWDPAMESITKKVRFKNTFKSRSEVMPDDGAHGIEFFIALIYPQFVEATKEQKWTKDKAYTQLSKVLNGTITTAG